MQAKMVTNFMKNNRSVTVATGSPESEACVDVQLNRNPWQQQAKKQLHLCCQTGPAAPSFLQEFLPSLLQPPRTKYQLALYEG